MKKYLAILLPLLASGVALAEPAAAEPVMNKADNAWIMVCAAFVILMSIPGLALFYGGLVRKKNVLSLLIQVFVVFSMISLLWVVYGYSVAFSESHSIYNAFFGSLDKILLKGITPETLTGTFSKGVAIPELTFVVFQGAFAAITCALIVGAWAERIKFSAVLLGITAWFTLAYLPVAHMVWFWAGPDAYTSVEAADVAGATAGWLFQKGALDFAGGTVVHINAAIAGLVVAAIAGKRLGYGRESMSPHNLTLTMIGAALLWFGWFGFNAGSALEASGAASLAFVNTWVATATATLSWMFAEWLIKGKPSMLGAASGAVSGLVAITPAAGFVGVGSAIIIGFVGGVVCLWGATGLKKMLKVDDSLDVFGIHGVGGITGALLTGVFADPALGGTGVYDYVTNAVAEGYSIVDQVVIQATAVGTTIIWSGVVAFVVFKLLDIVMGLRVPEDQEREGLDLSCHGETAYHD
jgi:Amt family ammonium transporter